MAQFVIRQVSNRGTAHPVVARLSVQMKELIAFSDASQEVKDGVLKVCFESLQSRLGTCWDIWQWLAEEERRCVAEYVPSGGRFIQIPNIDELDREVDRFLYESKNFLRDLLNDVITKFFPELDFSDAKSFFDSKGGGDGPFVKWASEQYGAGDSLTKALRDDQDWIKELVRKRNAVEHPGGLSGNLSVRNIEALPDGKITAPVWCRTDTIEGHISTEMEKYCENLLSFAEEVIIFGCIEKTSFSQIISFGEVPEAERKPECPVRFKPCFRDGVIGGAG